MLSALAARGATDGSCRRDGHGFGRFGLGWLLCHWPHCGSCTASNRVQFCACIAALRAGFIVFLLVSEPFFTPFGVLLAVLSGALTSALGYSLWYRVLPQIAASVAGVAQLVVPVLAMMGGMVLLDEVLTLNFIFACALVLEGIATALGPLQALLHWRLFKRSRS